MPENPFVKELTHANRVLLRAMRRHEAACKVVVARGVELGDAKRALRLLLQAIEPYTPPEAGAAARVNEVLDERL